MKKNLQNENVEAHHNRYGIHPELILKSPGRINIIGEHTDYHQGYAMPATVDESIYISLSKNNSRKVTVTASNFNEEMAYVLDEEMHDIKNWQRYVYGVVTLLGIEISGFNAVISGDIPLGAGMSSSAALCCGLLYGLSGLFDLDLTRKSVMELARKVEIDHAGVNCGYMDQYACLEGKADHCLFLDFRDLKHTLVPIGSDRYSFVIMDSHVPHDLGNSEYNTRRLESERALSKIGNVDSQVRSYRDLTQDLLKEFSQHLDLTELKRARHVVDENQRVVKAEKALKKQEWPLLGELLTESHISLKEQYEVTCAQTDYLVENLLSETGVLGARQIGGGFGGIVLALTDGKLSEKFTQDLSHDYQSKFGLSTSLTNVKIADGCSFI